MSVTSAQIPAPKRRSAAGTRPADKAGHQAGSTAIWTTLFIIALMQPGYLMLGDTQLGAPRLMMLLAAVPVAIAYLSGRAGPMRWPDLFFLIYPIWMFVTVYINHGSDAPFPLMIATFFETCVPYFLARVLIRDEKSFRRLFRALLLSLLFIGPFALMESLTGRNILSELYGKLPLITGFTGTSNPPRMGLERADSVFEHPILYGLYCTLPFSMAVMGIDPNGSILKRGFWALICMVTMVFSVSSSAILSIMIQSALMSWNWIMRTLRSRWKLLIGGGVFAYIGLSLVMDSSPLIYFSLRMSFSGGSAWNRVEILKYGMQNVWNNPIFGLGFHDWVRPSYMLSSLDNYWLLTAMRYGIVGFMLHVIGILGALWLVGRRNFSDRPDLAAMRTAYLITLAAFSVAIFTVSLWSAIYMLFIFLIGAGMWMANLPHEEIDRGAPAQADTAEAPRITGNGSGRIHYNRDHLRQAQPSARQRRRRR